MLIRIFLFCGLVIDAHVIVLPVLGTRCRPIDLSNYEAKFRKLFLREFHNLHYDQFLTYQYLWLNRHQKRRKTHMDENLNKSQLSQISLRNEPTPSIQKNQYHLTPTKKQVYYSLVNAFKCVQETMNQREQNVKRPVDEHFLRESDCEIIEY